MSSSVARAALRSRRLHAVVAVRVVRDPALRQRATHRLQVLRAVNPHGQVYHDRWEALLTGPLPALLRALADPSPDGIALRKESPLTVLVPSSERERVFRATGSA